MHKKQEVQTVYNTGETEDGLKVEYNPENSNLRKAQIGMTKMLEFLDQVCREQNLEYFLIFGTLLGARRHEGFIPWDDDVDVCMSNKDIKKFIKAVKRISNCKYVVQNHSSDRGYVRMWCVLRDTKSEYVIDDYIHNMRRYRGLQVDIFPYDKGVIRLGRILVHKTVRVNETYLLGKHVLLSHLWFICTKYMLIPFLKFCSLFANRKVISCGYESEFDMDLYNNWVFPLERIEFEGHMFQCPHDVDECLRSIYGDNYMDLPPKGERIFHSIERINFFDDLH